MTSYCNRPRASRVSRRARLAAMSHSPWHRLNATLTLAVAIFAVLVACASVTDVFHACAPTSSMPFMSRSPIVRVVDYERFARVADSRDEAVVRLEVDYDLSSCASWNTKMVFAHVTVSWETETRGVNEATIWDDAVKFDRWESAESKAKRLRKQGVIRAKYKLRSVDERLSGRGMEVKLRWAVTPRAGRIWRGETSTSNATFPVEYLNVGGDGQRARAAPRTPGMP